MNTAHKSRGSGITKILGTLLILFGAVIILEDYYYFYFDFWDFWPLILVVIGVKKITDDNKDYVFGGLLIAAGLFFLGNNLNLLPYFLEDNFFAFLLIVIGVFIISQKGLIHRVNLDEVVSDDFININAIFGSNERVVDSKEFSGGDCTAIFGSIDIDFRRSDIKDGGQPLYLNIIFGGITLYVPDDWNVVFECTTIFGSNEDNRKFRNEMEKDSSKSLVVKGLCLFGGTEIKS